MLLFCLYLTSKNAPICILGSIKIRIFFQINFKRLEVHWAPEIPNVKEFFKNIHSPPAGLSFKLTNQVATFI